MSAGDLGMTGRHPVETISPFRRRNTNATTGEKVSCRVSFFWKKLHRIDIAIFFLSGSAVSGRAAG
jgi:hypothetical protein